MFLDPVGQEFRQGIGGWMGCLCSTMSGTSAGKTQQLKNHLEQIYLVELSPMMELCAVQEDTH